MLFSELPKGLRKGLERTGYMPAGINPIYSHKEADTFQLTLMDGRAAILKAFHSHRARAVIELSAYRMAAEHGIPTVDVIYPTEIPTGLSVPFPSFIILEAAPAVTLEGAKSHRNYQSLLKQSAQVLARIHRIEGNKIGYLTGPYKVSDNHKTKAPFRRNLHYMKDVLTGAEKVSHRPAVRRVMEGLIERWEVSDIEGRLAEKPYNFVHGDYNSRNILVEPEKDKIVAVIDWAGARFDNRHFDLPHAVDIFNGGGSDGNAFLQYYSEAYGSPVDRELYSFYSIVRGFIADVTRMRWEPAARLETLERRLMEHGHADLAAALAA